MSANSHKSDYMILAGLGALTALILLAMVSWGWLQTDHDEGGWLPTSYSSNINGTLICYTLMERLGIAVERSETMFQTENLNQAGVILMLDPIIPVQSAEALQLKDWVNLGGVLITTDVPRGFGKKYRLNNDEDPDLCYGDSCGVPSGIKRKNKTATSVENTDVPLARDISEVYFDGSYIIDPKKFEQDSSKISGTLFSDNHGIRMAEITLGRGRIILLSDSSFLTNGNIDHADNAVLATNLISYAVWKARLDKVLFDEYHFGYGEHETGFGALRGLIFKTPAGWMVLSLTAAALLLMINKGRQFGARRGLQLEQRRSKLEYIHAVGSTYRTAGANGLSLRIIFKWFKDKTVSHVGLPANASNAEIAQKLAAKSGGQTEEYKITLDQCDRALGKERFSERRLEYLISKLSKIEAEVLNEQ